jgi:hypothetical protein
MRAGKTTFQRCLLCGDHLPYFLVGAFSGLFLKKKKLKIAVTGVAHSQNVAIQPVSLANGAVHPSRSAEIVGWQMPATRDSLAVDRLKLP